MKRLKGTTIQRRVSQLIFFTHRACPISSLSSRDSVRWLQSRNIDFFGEESITRVGGAGGRNWTERLPVRFVWLAAA
jgi:hypothetical protein